jgi:hypothetical protein
LRPALAIGDPAVLFIDRIRHLSVSAAGYAVQSTGPVLVRGLR